MAHERMIVGSVTYALKAKKALERLGIRVRVVKGTPTVNAKGCLYGIEYDIRHEMTVISEMRRLGIAFEHRRK